MLFKEIVGQHKIKQKLIETVKNNRVSHAQLFFGPEGCGKLALSIAYAQYLNCENRNENDSCGLCLSCIKYNKLIHPDLHFVYPVASTKKISKPISKKFIDSWRELLIEKKYYINLHEWYEHIGIENKQGIINAHDCNEIIKTLSLKSFESEYKVMIIWLAEKLFHSAAPKILKILEEPPGKTLFLLISENQEQIINTIKSRTQLVKIHKIDDEDLLDALKIKFNYSDDNAIKSVNCANGSLIESLKFNNNNDDEKSNFLTFRDWMRLCFNINVIKLTPFINEIVKTGREKQKSFFNYALKVIRYCLLFNYQNKNLLKLEAEELKFVQKISPYINEKNSIQLTEEFNKALYNIERNAHPKILFTDLSFTINKLLNC